MISSWANLPLGGVSDEMIGSHSSVYSHVWRTSMASLVGVLWIIGSRSNRSAIVGEPRYFCHQDGFVLLVLLVCSDYSVVKIVSLVFLMQIKLQYWSQKSTWDRRNTQIGQFSTLIANTSSRSIAFSGA